MHTWYTTASSGVAGGGVQGMAWFLGSGDVRIPEQACGGVQRAVSGALPWESCGGDGIPGQ